MFGFLILMGLCYGGAYMLKDIMQDWSFKLNGEERYKNGDNPYNQYMDHQGHMRDLDTDEFTNVAYDYETGDVMLRNTFLDPIRNLSEEWRERFYIEKRATGYPGRTTVAKENHAKTEGRVKTKVSLGQRFKDLDTGEVYVVRRYGGKRERGPKPTLKVGETNGSYLFYMSLYSGCFLRMSDGQKKWNDDIVNDINQGKYKPGTKPEDFSMFLTPEKELELILQRQREVERLKTKMQNGFATNDDIMDLLLNEDYDWRNCWQDFIFANRERRLMPDKIRPQELIC